MLTFIMLSKLEILKGRTDEDAKGESGDWHN